MAVLAISASENHRAFLTNVNCNIVEMKDCLFRFEDPTERKGVEKSAETIHVRPMLRLQTCASFHSFQSQSPLLSQGSAKLCLRAALSAGNCSADQCQTAPSSLFLIASISIAAAANTHPKLCHHLTIGAYSRCSTSSHTCGHRQQLEPSHTWEQFIWDTVDLYLWACCDSTQISMLTSASFCLDHF